MRCTRRSDRENTQSKAPEHNEGTIFLGSHGNALGATLGADPSGRGEGNLGFTA